MKSFRSPSLIMATLLAGLPLLPGGGISATAETSAKFTPPANKVLVFVGQDNQSVGGTERYTNGYADNIGVPAGITHYVYFAEDWTNRCGYTFKRNTVDGLDVETNWGAGPMDLISYLEAPKLKECLVHVSVSMEGNSEDRVADGSFDHLIEYLARFLESYPERIFFLRIGYEFDGSWNKYDPENFKAAFRRVVDQLRGKKLNNFATVMASSGAEKEGAWEQYWPGDDYVDWIGYSYWKAGDGQVALNMARAKGKPAFLAESTPRGVFINKMSGDEAWDAWYRDYFDHIERNLDVIQAISYINCDWDAQAMWNNWGNSRLEQNDKVRSRWLGKMSQTTYLNAKHKPAQLLHGTQSATTTVKPKSVCDDLNNANGVQDGNIQTETVVP